MTTRWSCCLNNFMDSLFACVLLLQPTPCTAVTSCDLLLADTLQWFVSLNYAYSSFTMNFTGQGVEHLSQQGPLIPWICNLDAFLNIRCTYFVYLEYAWLSVFPLVSSVLSTKSVMLRLILLMYVYFKVVFLLLLYTAHWCIIPSAATYCRFINSDLHFTQI